MTLNVKKTETMPITKNSLDPTCENNIGQSSLKQVDKCKYLGAIITANGRCEHEIRSRNAQWKQAFNKLKNILANKQTNKHLSFRIRERVLQCYVYSILTYGCETRVLSKAVEKRVQATEMGSFRIMHKIPWTARRTNERNKIWTQQAR